MPTASDQRDATTVDRLLTTGWIVAGLPILTSALAAWRDGWVPAGDAAIVAAKVADTANLDPALVGGWTSLGRTDPEPLHHAGALGIWLLALPTTLLGTPGAGLVLGAAAIALVSLALLAVCVRRWRAPGVEAVILVTVALMIARLGGDRLSDPNAPHIGVLPLLVVLVTTAGVLMGHHRQAWVLVAAGSLAAQTHLGYVPLVGVAVVAATATIVVRAVRAPDDRPELGRTLLIGAAIGLVAWTGPIVDQLADTQNLSRLVSARSASEEPTVGLGQAVDLLVDTTATPGGWVRDRATEGDLPDPSGLDVVLSVATLAGLAVVTAIAARRRDPVAVSLGATALGTALVATISAANVTQLDVGGGLLYYRFFWWPTGVLVTAALVVGALRAAGPRLESVSAPPWVAPAGVLAVAALLVPVGHTGPDRADIALYEPMVDHAEALADRAGDAAIVLLLDEPAGSPATTDELGLLVTTPTLLVELRLLDVDIRFPAGPFDATRGPLGAYAFDRPADGTESLTALFRSGAAALAEPPAGFTQLSFDPGTTAEGLPFPIPTAVLVAAS